MRFKITQVLNIEAFNDALNKCKGKIELHTSEGDCLNLKSKLSQLISLNVILCGSTALKDITIYIEDPEDANILMQYVAGEKAE